MRTRLALAGAVLAAAAALSGCSNTTGGTATCGTGCQAGAEPAFPTPRPTVSTPTAPPTPETPPGPTGTAAPGPVENLPTDDQGFAYIETKSGKTRCQLNSEYVGCESDFENAPEVDGEPANGVKVTAGGDLTWVLGNLGAIPTVTLDYRLYEAAGWTIIATPAGTRFVNDATGHGMAIAVEGVQSF